MALIGYARVSTEEQVTDTQLDDLRAAGCTVVFEEHASGAARSRPQLARALARVTRGDTLVVVRLDRLARSLKHLLELIERLGQVGVHLRSLSDPIDTSSPQGEFTLQILGAVAQLERSLISQRTKSALAAARKRGRVGGNPQLKARDPAAIQRLSRTRSAAHLFELNAGAQEWLPTVRHLRPHTPWDQVARAVNARLPQERWWTAERLKRATRRFVDEGLADKALLGRAPPKREDRAVAMVAAIARANPKATLAEIAEHLKQMRMMPPRGGKTWAPSSVKYLVDRAKTQRLIDA